MDEQVTLRQAQLYPNAAVDRQLALNLALELRLARRKSSHLPRLTHNAQR